jgi:hypothetical protein
MAAFFIDIEPFLYPDIFGSTVIAPLTESVAEHQQVIFS